jgi:hypothetical protein
MNFLKQKKVVFLILLAVLLFGSIALGYEMIIKNNPKNLYLLAEYKTNQQTLKDLKEIYGEEWELQKALLDKPSSSTSEVKMDLNLEEGIPGVDPFQQAIITSILDSSKIVINVDQDPVSNTSFSTFGLDLSGNNLFSAELYQSKEETGVQVPVLYDKFLFIQNNQFGEAIRKFDPTYSGPESLDQFMPNYNEMYKLPQELQEHIRTNYTQFLMDSLKEEYITLTKNVPYQSPEGSVNLRQIDIVMTEDDVKQFLVQFVDKLSKDEELLDLVAENLIEWMKIEEYYAEEDMTNPEYIKGKIEEGFNEMRSGLEQTRFPEGLSMTLLINKQELIVDRTFNFAVTDENDEGAKVNFTWNKWVEKDSNKTSSWVFQVQPIDDTDVAFLVEAQTTSSKVDDGVKEDLLGSMVVVENGKTSVDVSLDLSSFRTTEDGRKRTEYDFELGFNGTEFEEEQPIINGNVTRIVDQDLKENYSKQQTDFNLNVGMNLPYEGKQTINLIFNTTTDIQFKDQIDFPVLSEENGVNIATLSEEEMYMIGAEIERSIQQFILGNSSLLGF